jgi:multidrug resistance efflux pump
MSTAFIRTIRALEADRLENSVIFASLAAALLGLWCAWFFAAHLELFEVSEIARLEIDQTAQVLQIPEAGRVTSTRLALGQAVAAGDVLIEIDTNPERLQIAEARARLIALDPQREAHLHQVWSIQQARVREQAGTRVAVEEANARYREVEARASSAEKQAARLKSLLASGIISDRDYEQGQAEALRWRATAESLQIVASRLQQEQSTRNSDRDASISRILAEVHSLDEQKSTVAAEISRLLYEVERRQLRAPVAGLLADVAMLKAGAFVHQGDKVGTVVPSGSLKVVAEFLPPAALGRIRPGQPARLRLEGFPWMQYGSIRAKVSDVAGEVRDGRVRVELAVETTASAIPLQHGLPGAVEVEVERVSPATLVLRAAGQLIAAPRTNSGAGLR